jgi:hypothetical protein
MQKVARFSVAPISLLAAACLAQPHAGARASTDAITNVAQSSVKDQSIGNCWVYATAGWVESLNLAATGSAMNVSESYITYWHWFDQIANGSLEGQTMVSTGGSWGVAGDLMLRYGLMQSSDFIPEDVTDEASTHQASALTAINASLATGALATDAARQNRQLVRSQLDAAWALGPNVTAELDKVFGPDVSATIDQGADPTGTPILRPSDVQAALMDPTAHQITKATLADGFGTRADPDDPDSRTGPLAWVSVDYPDAYPDRRHLQERVQRALADHQPVVLTWWVDFNAMNSIGQFLLPPSTPGDQGGHMVIFQDYEIDNVPGYGTLSAGTNVTDPATLAAALDDSATIKFFRVKNSWGNYRPNVALGPQFAGYDDLYMVYLDGPMTECEENPDGTTNLMACHSDTPFQGVLLPPGY